MTIEEIRNFALSLPGTTEDIKWEHNLCFSVGSKIFLIANPDQYPVSASFKTTVEGFEELTNREGIIPAPYLARNKWVLVEDIERIGKAEWELFIKGSYDLVFSKLPKKIREQLL